MAFTSEQQPLSGMLSNNDVDGNVTQSTPIDRVLWQPLPYEVCRVWRQRMWLIDAVLACIVIIAAIAGWVMQIFPVLLMSVAAGALALCVLYAIAVPFIVRIRYGFTAFAIDERNIWVRDGWLFRNSNIVPFNRVQIITLSQGPLLRRQGLSSISVHTAFGANEVPALHTDQAKHIVDTVNARVLESREDD